MVRAYPTDFGVPMTSPSFRRRGPRQNRRWGRVLLILSVAGSLGLLLFMIYPADRSTSATGWQSAVQTIASILGLASMLGVVAFLLHRGERHLAPTGREAMRDDRRPPVLFLRSFEAEPLLPMQERLLASIVDADVGPFVAVGHPSDTLPRLGAARFYERDFEPDGQSWQEFVRGLLLRAGLVIIAPGATTGLGWEVAQCRELLAPNRLVVLLPGDGRVYGSFRRTAAEAGLALPVIAGEAFGWGAASDAVGIITFQSDWRASLTTFAPTGPFESFDMSHQEQAMRKALDPILRAVRSR